MSESKLVCNFVKSFRIKSRLFSVVSGCNGIFVLLTYSNNSIILISFILINLFWLFKLIYFDYLNN